MNNKIVLLIMALAGMLNIRGQSPAGIQWERNFGGTDTDFANVVKPTSDGGYIVGGYSYSGVSGNKTSASYGSGDYWVVKLDASGNKQWDKSYGGTNFDGINSLQQTSEGGYILGGTSFSDVSGNKTSDGYGGSDFWVVKLDAGGNKQWDKSYGGSSNEVLHSLQQTSDGGYILGGISFSEISGNKTSGSQGAGDYWIVKVDANGNKQWEKSYGGNDRDELHSLQQTVDGGYVLGGSSFSRASGNKTNVNRGTGTSDYWVVKVDASGNKQWDKSYGGDDAEELYAVQQTSDGGYILGGNSYSGVSGNKTAASYGSHDYWVVKLDSSGNKQWDKSCGGNDSDELYSVQQTSDGGYILGGISSSGVSGNKTSVLNSPDVRAYWLVKLGVNGDKQWEQAVRGTYSGEVLRLQPCRDGGFILAGLATSLPSAEPDFGVTKLSAALQLYSLSFRPNGFFQARLTGLPGTNYVLQATTNFTNWISVLTNNAADGDVKFVGTNASAFAKRFYRARQL